MKLGSLFDGAGGFPLAAIMCGIEPVWASEIESFPIAVTTKNFNMKHLGDIKKINGAEIEPVDIITGGSPCQDLSVAGKRAGLEGERSGLFTEMIRVIKEMRDATNGRYPNIVIWENVPGAFSSNKGEDFRCVIEEFCKVEDGNAYIPKPDKWSDAGAVRFTGGELAWRVLDAQFFGVPQRRRRIFLCCTYTDRGQYAVGDTLFPSAAEILFKRAGLSRDFKSCRKTWQRSAGCVEDCVREWGETNRAVTDGGGYFSNRGLRMTDAQECTKA